MATSTTVMIQDETMLEAAKPRPGSVVATLDMDLGSSEYKNSFCAMTTSASEMPPNIMYGDSQIADSIEPLSSL